ncbi:uncharacterized protein K441DRAFT_652411 [Cenococcum geophilum 1.58]|uniref:uncharacterized protein n=1 Tax=Cenococcum geophilum 1.58 TaxID=794803 RepID=UPI00358E0DC6|nr:hypothetical protein K441DRAFT_652411 [Cenococcum geophilum 1.58]
MRLFRCLIVWPLVLILVHTLYRMPRKPKLPLRPLLRVRGGNIPAFRCAVRRVHEIEDREREVRP